MDYTSLFNKEDQIAFNILQMLLNQDSGSFSRDQIVQRLSLTRYQINHVFDTLNADLIAVSGEEPSYIDEANYGIWHANNISPVIVQKLQLIFLYRSNVFAAFEYHFFYSNREPKTVFAKTHHFSRTNFYNELHSIKKILDQDNFFKPTSLVKDNEFTIRMHLFQLYYTLFNGIDEPFPELKGLISTTLDAYQSYFQILLKPTQKVKLQIYLKVWFKRLLNNEFLPDGFLEGLPINTTANRFLDEISESVNSQIQLTSSELRSFYYFLVSQEMIQLDDRQALTQTFPEAEQYTDGVMERLRRFGMLADADSLVWTTLRSALLGIHIQYTSFYIEPTTFTDSKKVEFFQELYPAFDLIIEDFFRYLDSVNVAPKNQNTRINLYFSYMFALINSIPPKMIGDSIHIFVDFSQGCLYTTYVSQSLDAFNHANIILEDELTSATDLYISDFQSDEIPVSQVIWQDPPTANDWSILADMILNLKQQKLSQYKEEGGKSFASKSTS